MDESYSSHGIRTQVDGTLIQVALGNWDYDLQPGVYTPVWTLALRVTRADSARAAADVVASHMRIRALRGDVLSAEEIRREVQATQLVGVDLAEGCQAGATRMVYSASRWEVQS